MKYHLVEIKWADSFGAGSSWGEIEQMAVKRFHCYSVGYLVHDGDDVKIIVPHMHSADEEIGAVESGCGDMTIPTCAVVEMHVLREARKCPAAT